MDEIDFPPGLSLHTGGTEILLLQSLNEAGLTRDRNDDISLTVILSYLILTSLHRYCVWLRIPYL